MDTDGHEWLRGDAGGLGYDQDFYFFIPGFGRIMSDLVEDTRYEEFEMGGTREAMLRAPQI